MTHKIRSVPKAAARQKGSVDIHVGERIRQRRAVLDLSLEGVASRVGVSAQQLQKYEVADNRITAGRRFKCAAVLDVPVSFFFDGLISEPSEFALPHFPATVVTLRTNPTAVLTSSVALLFKS